MGKKQKPDQSPNPTPRKPSGKWRDRIVELARVPASELRANPQNWRQHPTAEREAMEGILADVGMSDALLARRLAHGSLELLDGHLRADLAADDQVPVLILDVNDEEAKKLLAVFDPIGAMASADEDGLRALLAEVESDDPGLRDGRQAEDRTRPLCARAAAPGTAAVAEREEGPMSKLDLSVWIPSSHRTKEARRALMVLPSATLCVAESEYDDYCRAGISPSIIRTHPDLFGLARIRNFIRRAAGTEVVVQVDDDLQSVHERARRDPWDHRVHGHRGAGGRRPALRLVERRQAPLLPPPRSL